MKRVLMLLVALLTVGLFLPGCEDQGTAGAAADYGVQDGQRPKDKPKRPPPGPVEGGFQEGDDQDETEPPDDD